METKIRPIILSGGAGTRLWPMSRSSSPKQLHKLIGSGTMLQMTIARVLDRSRFAAPLIVASEAHAPEIERQLGEAGFDIEALVLEPTGRNTAAAIALAASLANPEDTLLVMPSDHLIGDAPAFIAAVDRAAPAAGDGWLVTFGIRPTSGETGYGYIRRGDRLSAELHRVERFLEKPKPRIAAQLACDGNHYWNAGIFMFRADAILAALETHAPDVLRSVQNSVALGKTGEGRFRPNGRAFQAAPSISVDHAIMEKAGQVAVVPVDMEWSDLGSWDALYEALEKDAEGNRTSDEVVAIRCRNSLIRSSGPVVAAIGVEGLIIVATSDAVLVVARGESQRVREAVEACRAADRHEVL